MALECSQSVAGALALLYVLSRERDVVLLPELGEASKESGTPRFIPSFCSHVITARASRKPDAELLDSLEIAANPELAEEPAVAGFHGPDLYLRTSGSTGTPKLTRMSHRRSGSHSGYRRSRTWPLAYELGVMFGGWSSGLYSGAFGS